MQVHFDGNGFTADMNSNRNINENISSLNNSTEKIIKKSISSVYGILGIVSFVIALFTLGYLGLYAILATLQYGTEIRELFQSSKGVLYAAFNYAGIFTGLTAIVLAIISLAMNQKTNIDVLRKSGKICAIIGIVLASIAIVFNSAILIMFYVI